MQVHLKRWHIVTEGGTSAGNVSVPDDTTARLEYVTNAVVWIVTSRQHPSAPRMLEMRPERLRH